MADDEGPNPVDDLNGLEAAPTGAIPATDSPSVPPAARRRKKPRVRDYLGFFLAGAIVLAGGFGWIHFNGQNSHQLKIVGGLNQTVAAIAAHDRAVSGQLGMTKAANATSQAQLRSHGITPVAKSNAQIAASTPIPAVVTVKGVAGENGANGIAGAAGAVGLQGPPGVAGKSGAPGTPGVAGAAGKDGSIGPSGAVGPLGPQGVTGAVGVAGPAGAAGTPGVAGAQGDVGPPGSDGATGATGPPGSDGADGATGATGPAGSVPAELDIDNADGTVTVCPLSADGSAYVCPAPDTTTTTVPDTTTTTVPDTTTTTDTGP